MSFGQASEIHCGAATDFDMIHCEERMNCEFPRISCDSEQAGGAGAVQVADAKEKLLEVGNKADGMKASCLAAVLPVPATPLGIR